MMDLSFSLEDDLITVEKLGPDLKIEMMNITENFRMSPTASISFSSSPEIPEPWPCAPNFTYCHILSLAANRSLFAELVVEQWISCDLDLPDREGLDALMQAAE
ncbi:unnamed protein product [Pleuronectes platessa]|uniref:Integrin beta subunit VWA domain-containing protein n=1 Tax=Pleuronectes platessa TaxID=8262 RepID=A0A9N7VEN9_PLEPL|nr:unnamed protein product [Pleuronectes platessa]